MRNDIERVFFTADEIEAKVAALGEQISKDFEGKDPLFVGVLKGCFVFMADLMRHVSIPCSMDFMAVSSYKGGTSSTGAVEIQKDLGQNIEGRHIIIIEDILDSGNTLNYLQSYLMTRKPASITIATLMDKPSRRTAPFTQNILVLKCPMNSLSATVSITTSFTVTFPLSACSSPRYIRNNSGTDEMLPV